MRATVTGIAVVTGLKAGPSPKCKRIISLGPSEPARRRSAMSASSTCSPPDAPPPRSPTSARLAPAGDVRLSSCVERSRLACAAGANARHLRPAHRRPQRRRRPRAARGARRAARAAGRRRPARPARRHARAAPRARARRARARRADHARDRRRARPGRRGRPRAGQPRPRDRRRLAGLARAPRGAGPAGARGARAGRQGVVDRQAPGRLSRPRPPRGRLPGPLAARRRLRDARPLPRRPPHDADARAPRGRRDGAAWSARSPTRRRPTTTRRVLAPIYALSQASAQRARPGRARDRQPLGRRHVARRWPAAAAAGGCARYALAVPFRLGRDRPSTAPGSARCSRRSACDDLRGAGLAAIERDRAPAADRAGAPRSSATPTARAGSRGRRRPSGARPAGTQLHNTGCWIFETLFMGRGPASVEPVLARRRDRARRRRAAAPGAPARRPAGVGAALRSPAVSLSPRPRR